MYKITDYGAVAGGEVLCTSAIQKAIDEAYANGGGFIEIPAGKFLSGSLHLRSNIELHLATGAELICSTNPDDMIDFLKDLDDDNEDTGWEGGCFLFAQHEHNITISGNGRIDGQGRHYFYDDDSDSGFHECPLEIRGLRPRTSFLEDIENLTVKDVTFYDSAYWTLHMAGCRNVLIENIRILNNERGANNDGIDPDCCQNVVIRGCIIRGGDDSVVVKTTAPMHKKYGISENIVITGCTMKSRSCALKIGTETWGDIRHIILSDCILEDCNRGFGIFSRDGGKISDILIHDVIGNTRRYADCTTRDNGIHIWWGKGDALFLSAAKRVGVDRLPGVIEDIRIHDLHMKCEGASVIAGEPERHISRVQIRDCTFNHVQQSAHVPDCIDEMPSARGCYKHEVPCLYLRDVQDIVADPQQFIIEESMQEHIKQKIIQE